VTAKTSQSQRTSQARSRAAGTRVKSAGAKQRRVAKSPASRKASPAKPVVRIVRASELAAAKLPLTPMRAHFATKENTRYVQGRRDWLQYLDPGLAEASGGRVRATLSAASGAMTTETGWHYHGCEMQIGYITRGWIELQYEDGTEVRLEAGDVMFVPGGVKHNELRTSADIAGIEITIPAEMTTVPCERPKNWQPKKAPQRG
jgi:quercetin dioxygenase-like cupin family protein